jgi:ribosomal-protein-alanine N-acetyltransferase
MRKLQAPEPLALELRRMVEGDLDAVLALQQRCFVHPWSAELVRRELTHDWSTVLVADDADGQLVGFLIYWLVHDEVHILNIATDPQVRRRGVARTLIGRAMKTGRERQCRLATLEVRRSNTAAIELYRAFGFRAVGVRPNYYVDEGEDAIVMVCDL